jgi:hypothetical protein
MHMSMDELGGSTRENGVLEMHFAHMNNQLRQACLVGGIDYLEP